MKLYFKGLDTEFIHVWREYNEALTSLEQLKEFTKVISAYGREDLPDFVITFVDGHLVANNSSLAFRIYFA